MASLSAIRDAIQAAIVDNIASIQAYDTVPNVVNVPAVVIVPESADFDIAFGRGYDDWQFDLYVLAQRAVADQGQDDLDSYITGAGANSIRRVIWDNRDLGLTDGTEARVAGVTRYGGTFESAGIEHIGAVLRLAVRTLGTA